MGYWAVELADSKIFKNPVILILKLFCAAISYSVQYKNGIELFAGERFTFANHVPDGCRFAKRCVFAKDDCEAKKLSLREVEPGHFVSCHVFG